MLERLKALAYSWPHEKCEHKEILHGLLHGHLCPNCKRCQLEKLIDDVSEPMSREKQQALIDKAAQEGF